MALEQSAARCTVPDTWAELDASRLMDCMDTTAGVEALFNHLQRTARDCGYGPIGAFHRLIQLDERGSGRVADLELN